MRCIGAGARKNVCTNQDQDNPRTSWGVLLCEECEQLSLARVASDLHRIFRPTHWRWQRFLEWLPWIGRNAQRKNVAMAMARADALIGGTFRNRKR